MAIKTDLLNEIKNQLGKVITPDLTTSSAGSDIFEAYVFTIIIEAAKNEGAQIFYKDVHGIKPAQFLDREAVQASSTLPSNHTLIPSYLSTISHYWRHIWEFASLVSRGYCMNLI